MYYTFSLIRKDTTNRIRLQVFNGIYDANSTYKFIS